MGIFYLQFQDINLYYLYLKNENETWFNSNRGVFSYTYAFVYRGGEQGLNYSGIFMVLYGSGLSNSSHTFRVCLAI